MVIIQENNLAIFGPFLDLQDFFLNRALSFKTSDSDFCDLLNDLFRMDKKKFRKKNQILKSYFEVPYENWLENSEETKKLLANFIRF